MLDPRDGPDSMVVHLVSASDQEEQVAFRAQMHTDSVQNADDANSLPRNVRLTFHMDGIPVTLNLTLNPRVDTRPPVYIGRNGTITRVDLEGTKVIMAKSCIGELFYRQVSNIRRTLVGN